MLKAEIEGIGIPDKGTPQGSLCKESNYAKLRRKMLENTQMWVDLLCIIFQSRYSFKSNNLTY